MLEQTSSFADLAQRAQAALGTGPNSLSRPFSLESLVLVDPSGWIRMGNTWNLDVVPENLQLATLTHSEMATDRFCRQLATVLRAVADRSDPHWTAVTCYYAAFYAAQAVLLQVGEGAIRVPPGLPFRGIQSVTSAPSVSAVGRTTLKLTPAGIGSHKATWSQAERLLGNLVSTEKDSRAIVVLETLRHEIHKPVYLSEARNEINYNLTASPFDTTAWSSLLFDVVDADEVENVLARSRQDRPERRFEIVALALGLLSQQLRQDFVARGGRVDRRQTRARAMELPQRSWLL